MKKLKIAILTEIINYHSGSRAPLEIAKHLSKLGQDVSVYAYSTMINKSAENELKQSDVKITLFEKPNIPYLGKYLSSISLYKTLTKNKPQIATFSGTPPFFFAAKLSGIPVVRIYQGTQFNALLEKKVPNEKLTIFDTLMNKIANIYIYLVDFTSFKLANAIVTISKYAKNEGEQLYKRKVDKIIYHGTSQLPKTSNKARKNDTVNIISVSRITTYKGFHLIIDALKKVKTKNKIKFFIVGSQPKRKYINYLKEIGKNLVEIIINPTDKALANLYKKSHVYAAADRYLYFGLPICEAARFAIPTVSLNLAAAKEIIVHNKTGFIANNPKEFSHFLEKLINNPKLRQKMGLSARKRAETVFTWENAAKEYLKLFEKVIN